LLRGPDDRGCLVLGRGLSRPARRRHPRWNRPRAPQGHPGRLRRRASHRRCRDQHGQRPHLRNQGRGHVLVLGLGWSGPARRRHARRLEPQPAQAGAGGRPPVATPPRSARSAKTTAVNATRSAFRRLRIRTGNASWSMSCSYSTGWIGIVSATIAAASQNWRPGSSTANGTSQTTYWIENTLFVTSTIRTLAVASATTVVGATDPLLRTSSRARRQPSQPRSEKPAMVASGST